MKDRLNAAAIHDDINGPVRAARSLQPFAERDFSIRDVDVRETLVRERRPNARRASRAEARH
jgi:hypothetical protein